ncbi:hypothetical protein C8F01DRAFT_1264334 [Mycena amicta]|nr:hypothetical protein C8F01DRAFT_1264334 [Mycena amicta]
MSRLAPAIPNSRPTAIALKAHQRLLGPQAAKYFSAEHEYLEFKLTDTSDIDEVLPKKGYLTTYLAYHCACNVDLVQEASAEACRRLDAVAKHAQGSAQHFDALEAFFLASPAPALDELDDIRRAADLACWAREAAL